MDVLEELNPSDTIKQLYRDGILQSKYIFSDAKKRPRNCVVAVLTIIVVVAFLTLLQTAVQKSPIVFLKLSEDQVGEYDLVLTPKVDYKNLQGNRNLTTVLNGTVPSIENGTDTTDTTDPNAATNTTLSIPDLLFGSGVNVSDILLNETWIGQQLQTVPLVKGTTPRWTLLGRVFNRDHPEKNSSLVVLIIDSETEEAIGLGRDWKLRPLGEQECYITSSVLRNIDIEPQRGERVLLGFDFLPSLSAIGLGSLFEDFLRNAIRDAIRTQNVTVNTTDIDINELLRQLGVELPPGVTVPNPNRTVTISGSSLSEDAVNSIADQIYDSVAPLLNQSLNAPNLNVELTVVDGVEKPSGKWPSSLGNVLLLEKKFVPAIMKDLLPSNDILTRNILAAFRVGNGSSNSTTASTNSNSTQTLNEAIDNLNLNDYALLVLVQYRDRFTSYLKNQKGLNADMIEFTNAVAESLGVNYPAEFTLPLVTALQAVYFIRLFLDQIFLSVLAILVLLGVMLIYSLLMSDTEEKTYEFGMLRALGLPHNSLVEMLVLQSLFYSIPGVSLGLLVAFLLFVPTAAIIGKYSETHVDPSLTWNAIVMALVLGFGMPLIGNIAPIQRALSKTLRDSLDLYHQTFNETTVQMIRLENLGLSMWQVALSIVLVVIGFVVYYLIPLSFTFNNLPLFFGILNGILIGMVLGTAAVATTMQPFLERHVLSALLWGNDTNLKTLIRKSLAGHRSRNRKTALMFTISLAFVIFSGAMFSLQARSLKDNVEAGLGGDIMVLAPLFHTPLREAEMREFLNSQWNGALPLAPPPPPSQSNSTNTTTSPPTTPAPTTTAPPTTTPVQSTIPIPPWKTHPIPRVVPLRKVVETFSFTTFPLAETGIVSETRISNLASFPTLSFAIFGVERNYLESAYTKYYVRSESSSQFSYFKTAARPQKEDTIQSLYDDAGKQLLPQEKNGIVIPPSIVSNQNLTQNNPDPSASYYRSLNETYTEYVDFIISQALRDGASIRTDTALRVRIAVSLAKFLRANVVYLGKVRAMLSKLPGFFPGFSSYKQTAPFSAALITMDAYQRLLEKAYAIRKAERIRKGQPEPADNSTEIAPAVPPKQRLLVKLAHGATNPEREYVINGIRNFIPDSTTFVFDTKGLIATTSVATDLLILFFNIVAAIAVFLCFFMLWLSFAANVNENAWEFGVLRAIGLSSAQVIRAYIYEALSVIITAVFMGSIIGLLIAITLTLQFNLFTEMPFAFDFPYILFFSVLAMSLFVAVLGSYVPARSLRSKQIASALKGN